MHFERMIKPNLLLWATKPLFLQSRLFAGIYLGRLSLHVENHGCPES